MNGLVIVAAATEAVGLMQFATDCRLSSPGWDAKSSEIGSALAIQESGFSTASSAERDSFMRRFSLSPPFSHSGGVWPWRNMRRSRLWRRHGPAAQQRPKHSINPFGIVVQNLDFVFFIICLCSIIGVTLIIQDSSRRGPPS